MKPSIFPALALLSALSPDASAETFRCGSRVVSSALSTAEIIQACGEPNSRTSSTQDVRAVNQNGYSSVVGQTTRETWVYQRGTRAAPMVITVVDGKIKSIERLR